MKKYIYTDLAFEGLNVEGNPFSTHRKKLAWGELFETKINTERQARALGRPRGKYVTLMCEKMWLLDETSFDGLQRAITDVLLGMLVERVMIKKETLTLLVAGLGNDAFCVDAVGPRTAAGVCATRHLLSDENTATHRFSLAAMAPSVLANSGMEALEQVTGVCKAIGADAVLAVDALAASHYERIGTTVQIADSGICPGSGVGNARRALTKQTLGIPVIAIGVPTVVDASTMICDALMRGGIKELTPSMEAALSASQGLFVCPKESDLVTQSAAVLLAEAINALGGIKIEDTAYSEA